MPDLSSVAHQFNNIHSLTLQDCREESEWKSLHAFLDNILQVLQPSKFRFLSLVFPTNMTYRTILPIFANEGRMMAWRKEVDTDVSHRFKDLVAIRFTFPMIGRYLTPALEFFLGEAFPTLNGLRKLQVECTSESVIPLGKCIDQWQPRSIAASGT